MRPLLPVALLSLFAVSASAGFKDGVYTSAEHGTRFKLPKDWKLEETKSEDGKVAKLQSADRKTDGVFRHVKEGMGASKHAKWRSKEWEKKGAAVTWDSEEKPEGREGDWLKVVLDMEAGPDEYKSVHLFFSKGTDDFEFALMTRVEGWGDAEKVINEILASLEFGEFKEDAGEAPAGGAAQAGMGLMWADAARGIAVRGAAGWKYRTEDFRIHDPNEIVEWETGDEEVLVCLSEIANDGALDAKTWADLTVKALGNSFKNQKLVEAVSPAGTERRDFTAESEGRPVRFAYLFFTRHDKSYYLQVMAMGETWDKSKDLVEGMFASLALGDVAAQVEEMKSQPAAGAGTTDGKGNGAETAEGGKEVLLPNPWEGCGKGSWSKYNLVSEASGTKTEMEMTTTLVDFDAETYTVKTDMVMGGNAIPGQEQKVNRRQKVAGDEATKPEEGDEKITVPKGEFSCHWTRTKSAQGWSQAWTCSDVPGQTVKAVSEYGGSRSVMELVEFQKK
ncbi:MAG: hypothetical protein AAB074_07935 [Planctomycetota bacterium]